MSYTPDEIAKADQTLAGIDHQLDRLIAQTADPVVTTDTLAEILRWIPAKALALALATAVQKLAAARCGCCGKPGRWCDHCAQSGHHRGDS